MEHFRTKGDACFRDEIDHGECSTRSFYFILTLLPTISWTSPANVELQFKVCRRTSANWH